MKRTKKIERKPSKEHTCACETSPNYLFAALAKNELRVRVSQRVSGNARESREAAKVAVLVGPRTKSGDQKSSKLLGLDSYRELKGQTDYLKHTRRPVFSPRNWPRYFY